MRRDFMADISHELRTPLAVLRGELEAIQDGGRQFTPDSVASLQAEVATLTKLVDDLHQLSLSDEGALAYQKSPVDIVTLLEMAVGAFRKRFSKRHIGLQLSLPNNATVFGDRDRVMQLLIDGNVKDHTLILRFSDSALGVSDAQLNMLFERFYRTESSRNRASGGSGLGLAICHNIVAAHGGTITASHSPLGGSALQYNFLWTPT